MRSTSHSSTEFWCVERARLLFRQLQPEVLKVDISELFAVLLLFVQDSWYLRGRYIRNVTYIFRQRDDYWCTLFFKKNEEPLQVNR
jgi:hypothetical protein